MTISQMHDAFRVYGQQKGMQHIRTILPEEIDIYLNGAITEKVRTVLLSNTQTVYRDKIAIQHDSISPINAIRTLYGYQEIKDYTDSGFIIDETNLMYITSVSVKYNNDSLYGCRFIEPDRLENTLNDFCNSPSYEYPICTLLGGGVYKIYNNSDKTIESILVRYIKTPNKVDFDNSVDCDLPEYIHDEIVRMAVESYFGSVGSTTQNVNN